MLQLEKNKGFAEDLTEGKFSFPIIHGILSHPENNQIMNILSRMLEIYFVILFVNDSLVDVALKTNVQENRIGFLLVYA